jgi:hypothetical protein
MRHTLIVADTVGVRSSRTEGTMAGADLESRRGQRIAEWRIDGQLWIEDFIRLLGDELTHLREIESIQVEGFEEREAWWEANHRVFSAEFLAEFARMRAVVEARFARTRELIRDRRLETERELERAHQVLTVYRANTPVFTGESAAYLTGGDEHGAERYARRQEARIEPTGRCPACAVPVGERWCDDHDLIDRWLSRKRAFDAAWPAPLFGGG